MLLAAAVMHLAHGYFKVTSLTLSLLKNKISIWTRNPPIMGVT